MSPWAERVVPITVEPILPQLQGCKFFVGDFDAFLVSVLSECCIDSESLPSSRVAYQIDNNGTTDERPTTPILSDVAKHAMFNLVPFARSRRKMANGNRQTEIVCEMLNTQFPKT